MSSDDLGPAFELLAGFAAGLKDIASIHPMIGFGIMQLICNVGHALLIEEMPNDLWNKQFDTRRDAISEAFQITGAKFGDMMSSEAIKNITPLVVGAMGALPSLKDIVELRGRDWIEKD